VISVCCEVLSDRKSDEARLGGFAIVVYLTYSVGGKLRAPKRAFAVIYCAPVTARFDFVQGVALFGQPGTRR